MKNLFQKISLLLLLSLVLGHYIIAEENNPSKTPTPIENSIQTNNDEITKQKDSSPEQAILINTQEERPASPTEENVTQEKQTEAPETSVQKKRGQSYAPHIPKVGSQAYKAYQERQTHFQELRKAILSNKKGLYKTPRRRSKTTRKPYSVTKKPIGKTPTIHYITPEKQPEDTNSEKTTEKN